MPDTIAYPQVCQLLQAAVGQIRANHELLSRLDSAVGDGDHGTTILRTMEAVAKAIADNPGNDLKALLAKIAWDVMDSDGGSTGPLLGSWFMGMSDAVADQTELDCAALVAMLAGGIHKLAKQSRAGLGDKTMMDAFLPALDALQAAAPAGDIRSALQQAAAAAATGAEATKEFRAKFGRARNLGERVIGHLDPGAVSVSLIFKGFSEALGSTPAPSPT
ncbi:MAG: dihydroxyacetone kinase subunit DhaL [Verrucomicrobia bacterium]|nr:dihydroxyacetone kinase subunit DhaL [Verrucomicrobiota bacterium]